MGFFDERNRPPPRPLVLRWLRAWALGGRGSAAWHRTPFLDPPCMSGGGVCPGVAVCVAGRGGSRYSGARQVRQAGEFMGSEQVTLVMAWLVSRGWYVGGERRFRGARRSAVSELRWCPCLFLGGCRACLRRFALVCSSVRPPVRSSLRDLPLATPSRCLIRVGAKPHLRRHGGAREGLRPSRASARGARIGGFSPL